MGRVTLVRMTMLLLAPMAFFKRGLAIGRKGAMSFTKPGPSTDSASAVYPVPSTLYICNSAPLKCLYCIHFYFVWLCGAYRSRGTQVVRGQLWRVGSSLLSCGTQLGSSGLAVGAFTHWAPLGLEAGSGGTPHDFSPSTWEVEASLAYSEF